MGGVKGAELTYLSVQTFPPLTLPPNGTAVKRRTDWLGASAADPFKYYVTDRQTDRLTGYRRLVGRMLRGSEWLQRW